MRVAVTVLLLFRFSFLRFRGLFLRVMLPFRFLLTLLFGDRVANGIEVFLFGRVKLGITGADSFTEFPQFRLSCLNRFGHTL